MNLRIDISAECGANFTSKLEGMFKDMHVSRDLMTDFRQCLEEASYPYDMTVNALTMGTWPSFSMIDINLPSEFSDGLSLFERFYQARYNGRKITWQHSMGHCTMSCRFPSGNKVIAMSLTQAVVMLLFNSASKLSFQQIKDATKIGTQPLNNTFTCEGLTNLTWYSGEKDLISTLLPLFAGKVRLLVKTPKGSSVDEESVFYYNKVFKHKLVRLQINQVQMKETDEERKETKEGVFLERQYQVGSISFHFNGAGVMTHMLAD